MLIQIFRATGKYCDTLGIEWLSDTDSSDRDCHDCILGTLQTRLNSPFDYTEESEEDFRSLTASCSKTQYPVTSPAPYAISTWDTETPVPTPTCTNPISLSSGDTCSSIATQYNVSTDNLLSQNSIPWGSCKDLGPYGSLCLPDQCNVHKLNSLDTCDSIVEKYGISDVQFLAWNPNINSMCTNLRDYTDSYLCVGYVFN